MGIRLFTFSHLCDLLSSVEHFEKNYFSVQLQIWSLLKPYESFV